MVMAKVDDPVEFTLETADMVLPAAENSTFAANGTLLGEPFSLEFNGGTLLESYLDQKWPIALKASGGGAELKVNGTIVEGEFAAGTKLNFDLAGKQIGDLARWVGAKPKARARYKLNGTVELTGDGNSCRYCGGAGRKQRVWR